MFTATVLIILFLTLLLIYFRVLRPSIGASRKQIGNTITPATPNYSDGTFKNQIPTPSFAEGYNIGKVIAKLLKGKSKRAVPQQSFVFEKTPLRHIDPNIPQFIWFGHSSYLLFIDGKKILVDPVFSNSVSPLRIGLKAFKGSNLYQPDDLPEIDYLIITHDHWDHLDYQTLKALRPKIKQVITALGVGAHLRKWGFSPQIIHELNWWEELSPEKGFRFTSCPARHFSGRWMSRNITLWSAFMLQTPTLNIFLGGDSGYGPHFKEIGERFPQIDWAILENGQYDDAWKYIHLLPEEFELAASDLHARYVIPVHNSKFSLGYHDWDAPMRNIFDNGIPHSYTLVTPPIGAVITLNQPADSTLPWWTKYV